MNKITYKENIKIDINDITNLYNDAEWRAYTKDLEQLKRAIDNSTYVLSVWDNDKLVGLIRVISDNNTIAFIQDILILKSYKRMGIGTFLLQSVLKKYAHLRQKALLTEDSEVTRTFYEANGLVEASTKDCLTYINKN